MILDDQAEIEVVINQQTELIRKKPQEIENEIFQKHTSHKGKKRGAAKLHRDVLGESSR